MSQPTQAPYATVAPPPDPNAANEIQQQGQHGDQAEKDVTAGATQGSGGL